ncbi:hypothetical protein KEM52_001421 [Ascosphaera acerosa]|nr:hypothetical protein KEM52_001421 [Ascosphaera acerosa]
MATTLSCARSLPARQSGVAAILTPTPRRTRGLAPLASAQHSAPFSTSRPAGSRIGSAPITIPREVDLHVFDLPKNTGAGVARGTEVPKVGVEVKGPRGTLTLPIPSFATLQYDQETRRVTFAVNDSTDKKQRAMWGTVRALFNNTVTGVSEGYVCILRIVGVTYRASVDDVASKSQTGLRPAFPGQKFVNLKLGYARPVELPIPAGITGSAPQPNMILLEGIDKQRVKQFAAEIREWRKPEPYKGKGIFIDDETIRMKAKKIK